MILPPKIVTANNHAAGVKTRTNAHDATTIDPVKEDGRVGSYVWVDSSPFEFGSDFHESIWVESEPNSVIIYHKTCKEIPVHVKFNEIRSNDFV